MKILIIGTTVVPMGSERYGGIEKMVLDFVKMLSKTDNEITVAAPYGSKVPDNVKLIETVHLPEFQDRDDIVENILNLDAYRDKFDVIHDFTHKNVFKDKDNAVHMTYDPIRTVFPFKSKKNMIAFSNWQKERFERAYSQKALVMPCNMVDTDVYKPDPAAKRERFLFLAKMTPDKGAHLALQYCAEMGVPLDIVGGLIPSDTAEYAAGISVAVKEHGPDMTFNFNVTEDEKLKFLQNAKGLLYPQQLEDPHWLTGIEAWMCATPTIANNRASMLEISPHTPFVVNDPAQFKDRMFHIDAFDTEYALQFARDRYSVNAVRPLWLALYKDVSMGLTWA